MVQQDSGMVAVRNILTRLCKRSGLSPERLRTTEIDVGPLLDLPAVRRHAHRTGLSPEEAVLPVVRDLARHLPATHRLITDAELSLGLLREDTPDGVDLDRLYAQDLGERREYLTQQWQLLHEAADADHIPPAPTVRSLRATPERRAFSALAGLLTTGPVFGSPVDAGITVTTTDAHEPAPGVLTVIGDAVIDHIYRVDHVPAAGTSTRGSFEAHPGGKGLNRAVAAARLGLDVRLVAAVGDDEAGRQILDYLRAENVDTELVSIVRDAATPVTSVMITATGVAASIGCKDDRIRLGERELTGPALNGALAASDAILLTFEQPLPVIEQVMARVRRMRPRPLLMVHPAPPVDAPQHLYQHLGAVDYLMGATWELDEMVPEVKATSGDHIARHLRALGVRTVCVIDDFACTVRSEDLDLDVGRFPAALSDSPGARAAFAGALAYRLLSARRPAQEQDYVWATAAMVATQSFGDIPGAMPLAGEIDRLVRLGPEER
ncbi:hypothetical protein GV791_24360 [Nocardia cyriacigeorgica]|uniref:Carbohydrate kinase PfkB domain-containing protein n=2 Tax=Nocardia cyriacigeorgica TaxID=135487 RepID=H6R816_NOCCG|nr:PfkB family carbohydrate kinase [Nocardia cyriacigeorgica]MBF6080101.1 hypothetical protein [Nocardia cyriacigeorgica]NEW35677.1 hypothetical protein [Nocardia cyriacigeorgica]CCF63560.1 conserved protein of unknown function, putative Ribokinase domain [Nocardia cyriacigeorgica GUH-2]BDT87211.1 ribokinase [Nocardia cyriacigeorgica]BDU06705.1 ribokinase [Nocardia cyriacigeorgica]